MTGSCWLPVIPDHDSTDFGCQLVEDVYMSNCDPMTAMYPIVQMWE
jgi:hypothetical protein